MNPQMKSDVYATVLVANIDIGCNEQSVDVVKVSNRVVDDEGNVATQIFDKHEEWNHTEYFQVKFDGKPYRVAPGKTALLPRFVAEHFAKHLADHLLQKKEDETGRRGLVQSPLERPKALSQILREVNNELLEAPVTASTVVDAPEQPDVGPVEDAGVVPNPALGTLVPEPPTLDELLEVAGETQVESDVPPLAETSISDPAKPEPTRKQLIELCHQQNIDITGKENKAQLIEKLKRG